MNSHKLHTYFSRKAAAAALKATTKRPGTREVSHTSSLTSLPPVQPHHLLVPGSCSYPPPKFHDECSCAHMDPVPKTAATQNRAINSMQAMAGVTGGFAANSRRNRSSCDSCTCADTGGCPLILLLDSQWRKKEMV